mmetsp:Transcript_9971/g.11375  ORF Transcript_9971/g.11375 Transcript_9971/m.11375 type:complete len:855 (+) Transcript_9971:261-2825(+)
MTASSITRGGVASTTAAMKATAAAAILLLAVSLSSSGQTLGVSAHTGGFQSGPSPGAVYAGGLHYEADEDTVYLTGSHYNIDFTPHDGTANDLMQGTELDGASSCFVAKLDVSDNDEMEAADLESFHTLTNWKSYGDPGVMETCAAITTDDDHNQAFVVGSVAKGGFFHKVKDHKLAGLTAVLRKDNLAFVNAAIQTTDDMSSMYGKKHLLYPISVIHSKKKPLHIFVAALTSTDREENPNASGLKEPDMQKVHLYGTSFFVSVLKIKFHFNNKNEPELVWLKSFPVKNNLNTGAPPPVFIGGMLKQEDINGVSHLLIAGSTRGSGEGYGASEADTNDEDGFIMQLNPVNGSLLAHSRHQGKTKNNKKQNQEAPEAGGTNNLREGTSSDDFIRGICHADENSENPSVDEFYIVGGTKGDMTTNEQGTQNALEEVNAGFQFGVGVEQKYRDLWTRDESLMPFLRRVSFQKQLGPVWTTQWAAMPSKEAQRASGGPSKTNAYAMDCVVDSVSKNVYVVGTVLKGASMTQGDVEMVNQGGDDLWVAKVDGRTGNVHWMTQLGNYGDEAPARHKSIALNTDGNLIIYGDTTSNLYRARSEDDTTTASNQGNEDDDESPYGYGQTRDTVSDMFIMVVNGQTGAVDDKYYMGGTSSASVTGSVDGVPRQTTPPRPPPTNDIPMKDENSVDPTMKEKNASTMNETKTKSSGKGGIGKIMGILFGILAVGFGLHALFLYYQKKKQDDSQKSTIFQCLQKFDVEDIDLRRSPPGGWHGTYMNKLAYGVNDSENDGGSEMEPLGGSNMNSSTNYEDQKLYSDQAPGDPSLGGGGSRSGYKDNFEIDGEDEQDEVDIRLQGKNLV